VRAAIFINICPAPTPLKYRIRRGTNLVPGEFKNPPKI